jgi:epoxyqueuosine reductase QueG
MGIQSWIALALAILAAYGLFRSLLPSRGGCASGCGACGKACPARKPEAHRKS